jgi:hypothetical protein
LPLGALGVAVSFDLTRSAIVAAGSDADRVPVKPLQHGPGTAWVVPRLVELQRDHGGTVVVDGRGPAASLIPDMEAAGLTVHVASTVDVLDSCAQMYALVREGKLSHAKYPELEVALKGASTRPVGDRWAWGRKTSSADISPLEAASLAAWWVARPEVPFVSVYEKRDLKVW